MYAPSPLESLLCGGLITNLRARFQPSSVLLQGWADDCSLPKPLLSQTWSMPPQHFYRQVLNYCSPRNRASKASGADARQTLIMKCRVKPTLDIQGGNVLQV